MSLKALGPAPGSVSTGRAVDTLPPPARGGLKPLLHVRRLTKYFVVGAPGRRAPEIVRAVDGVSLYVRPGETLGLIGESGSGKTTLLHALALLTEPDYGRIEFDGVDLLALPPRERARLRRRLQIVLQAPNAALPLDRNALFAVGQGLAAHGIVDTAAAGQEVAKRALEKVGLRTHDLARPLAELSSGDRARVLLARSLALEPAFIALDDPLAALDPASRAHLGRMLIEVQQAKQTAYVLASRDLDSVAELCQRVAVLYAGCLVETGPTASVLTRPRHPYTQALVAGRARLRKGPAGQTLAPREAPGARGLPQLSQPQNSRRASGCPFQPRCPKAGQGCDTLMPGSVEVGSDQQRIACWFPDA